MPIINDQDWNALGQLFRSAQPYPSICIDNFLEKQFADQLAASYPKIDEARLQGREFRTVNERLKVMITDPERFPDPAKALSEVIGSEAFLGNLTTLTGINGLTWDPSFTGGGMHLTGSTGILDVHVDFNFEKKLNLYRRLNILLYLNPIWENSWGGEVELWDDGVKNLIRSFKPIHNRCVLFETSDFSWHGVNQVKTPENKTRNSFAAYYYTEDSGNNSGAQYGGYHSTIFKARPTETTKRLITMPAEKMATRSRKFISKVKGSLKG